MKWAVELGDNKYHIILAPKDENCWVEVVNTSRTGLQYTQRIAAAAKRKRLIKLARATNAAVPAEN